MIEEIIKDGVTYYVRDKSICCDINVAPNVTEVCLKGQGDGGRSGRIEYRLKNCKKCFPDVEKLYIGYGAFTIEIPNSLFPNVKEVECESDYGKFKKSGRILIADTGAFTVLNTFVKSKDGTIDLKGVAHIGDNAFNGCLATKIINSGNITKCPKDAFIGSAIGDLKPTKGSALVVWSILIDIDHSSADITIPDKRAAVTIVREGVSFYGVKSITVNKVQTLINLQDIIPDGIKVKLNDKNLISREQLSIWKNVPYLELCCDNPYYSTQDGILCTKDGSALIKSPSSKNGAFYIPDGVITIAANAFWGSNIEEIYFSDSVRILMPNAFSRCRQLKKIDFGNGIEEIGFGHQSRIFDDCPMLQRVEIPAQVRTIAESAFLGAGVKEVIFHEGLTQIQDNAFCGCKIKEVTLPASLRYIGANNFSMINTVTLLKDEEPYGIVSALASLSAVNSSMRYFIIIKKPDSTIFMPRYMTYEAIQTADMNLAIPSFRTICEDGLYDYGVTPEVKWETAIAAYSTCPNSIVESYLRRVSKNIIKNLINLGNEEKLIEYIKLGVMTPKALDDTYEIAKKKGMTTVAAYILEAKNSSKVSKVSFRL